MHNEIKILRLKNGEDIIGYVTSEDNQFYDIMEPMTVDVETRGANAGHLIMYNWLPIQLIKENMTTLKSEDILTILEPEEQFMEYYSNMVEKLNNILQAKQEVKSMSEEQITEILNSMEQDRVLH